MKFLPCLIFATLSAAAADTRNLSLRAYLHDPVKPVAGFQYPAKSGQLQPLPLMVEGLSDPCEVLLTDGELLLRDAAGTPAARVKVPDACQHAAVIILPAAAGASPRYRMVLLEDSPRSFPWGTSRIVSLLPAATAVHAGEHKLPLPAGKITPLPEVRKLDDFNMAQVDFHYRDGDRWVPFTERRLQFTGEIRRIFIVHATPGARQPAVVTLVDHLPLAVE